MKTQYKVLKGSLRQAGFTLIELMVTVAIVAILATIALPAYQTYNDRARVSEAILAASACRSVISEGVQFSTVFPAANSWGCSEGPGKTKHVQNISTSNVGVVTIQLRGLSTTGADGQSVEFEPQVGSVVAGVFGENALVIGDQGNGEVVSSWKCAATAGHTIIAGLLPGSCR